MTRRFHATHGLRRYAALLAAFLLLGTALGCGGSVRLVDTFKDRQAEGDFAWIAQQAVTCAPTDDGCNQLHLIKGDACFRLAEQAAQDGRPDEAATQYACAVDELAAGIEQTTDWSAAGDRAQWYANWCEALRQLRDTATGAAADAINDDLQAAAEAFAAAEPGHPGAVYYRVNAQVAALRLQLLDPADHPGLCGELTGLHAELTDAATQAADGAFAAPIEQLLRELDTARSAVPGCA